MMGRKDFELIAHVIQELPQDCTRSLVTLRLAYAMQENYPRFSYRRFLHDALDPKKRVRTYRAAGGDTTRSGDGDRNANALEPRGEDHLPSGLLVHMAKPRVSGKRRSELQ